MTLGKFFCRQKKKNLDEFFFGQQKLNKLSGHPQNEQIKQKYNKSDNRKCFAAIKL